VEEDAAVGMRSAEGVMAGVKHVQELILIFLGEPRMRQ
jgi:hypothetical protein